MELSIIKCPFHIDKRVIHLASEFYAKELLTPRRLKKLTLDVEFLPKKEMNGNLGIAYEDEGDHFIELVNHQSAHKTLVILAHEMVHVKQNMLKEHEIVLIDGVWTHTWLKEPISLNGVSYRRRPWEKEAYDKEIPLFMKFIKEYRREVYVR